MRLRFECCEDFAGYGRVNRLLPLPPHSPRCRWRRCALWVACWLLASGCSGVTSTPWVVRFANPNLRASSENVEITLARDCGATPLYQTNISVRTPTSADAPPRLAPGDYALHAEARNATCQVVAESGCIMVHLPTSAPVVLTLFGQPQGLSCSAGFRCDNARCVATNRDAGLDAPTDTLRVDSNDRMDTAALDVGNDATDTASTTDTAITDTTTTTDTAIITDTAIPSDTSNPGISGFTVAIQGGVTTEAGGTTNVTVRLTSQPSANVTVNAQSDRPSEGTIAPSSLTFTTENWATPQTITATGVNDAIDDGNQVYTVSWGATISADPAYAAIRPDGAGLANVDDDTAGITVSSISNNTTEAGGTATFTIVLTSEPTANVTVNYYSNNISEGTVSPLNNTFSFADWNIRQTVTVTGRDDLEFDGSVAYGIAFLATTSNDASYSVLVPSTVSVVNEDNETTAERHTVNGVTWYSDVATCGQPCNSLCATFGLVPEDDATVFAAQDTQTDCENIATAFDLASVMVSSFAYACAEYNNTVLMCSQYAGCPQSHREHADGQGLDCQSNSFRSICGCR